MQCTQSANIKNCTCTYAGCWRKGKCCECIKYHKDRGELPGCLFSPEAEASYDRSISAFIKDNS